MIGETGGPQGPASQPLSFEEALARLEAIVRDLEGSDMTLEETLARYEEGSRLVRECTVRLEEAEQRIRVLTDARGGQAPERADPALPREEAPTRRREARSEPESEPADGDDLPF
jgi:exodeoxyribonuclease VII small subunit